MKKAFERLPKYAIAIICVVVGVFGQWAFSRAHFSDTSTVPSGTSFTSPADADGSIREADERYQMIKPLLLCSEKSSFYQDQTIEAKFSDYINRVKASGQVTNVAVYFKDLNSGSWTAVNGNDRYSPASLLKVALMLSYYKLAEINPSILSKQVVYESKQNLNANEHFEPTKTLQTGGVYTFDSIIKTMISNSDNNAFAVLQNFADKTSLSEVYSDLGMPQPPQSDDAATIDFLSVKTYAHIFRVLYSATYLTRELSEKALEILSQTRFSQGLRAGLPDGTIVANKFGERTVQDTDQNVLFRELHDCGIVYAPQHPYIMCVMTKGDDFTKLARVISSLSSIAYKYETTQN
ncbi:serine hydrolase [bacterium]|nr:serine hydrolase [bacterium]